MSSRKAARKDGVDGGGEDRSRPELRSPSRFRVAGMLAVAAALLALVATATVLFRPQGRPVKTLELTCDNVATAACVPGDGWGDIQLCDSPWNEGPPGSGAKMTARYYGWLPSFIRAIPHNPGRPFVIDVGANVGIFSVASAVVGLRVVAFEPVPHNHEGINRMVCANAVEARPRIAVVPAAIGAATVPGGTTIFVPYRADNAAMTGQAATANLGHGSAAPTAVTVPLIAVDDWLRSGRGADGEPFLPSDLVWFKADVQGYESFVLQGAEATLKAATHPAFRITVEEDAGLYAKIPGAVAPSSMLEAWGFVTATRTPEGPEGDMIWVNPKYYRGGDIPSAVPGDKRPAKWWEAGGALLPSAPVVGGAAAP